MAFYEEPHEGKTEYMQYRFSSHKEDESIAYHYTYPHYHEMIELQYCTRGTLEVSIGKNTYTLKEGDLCIANSNEVHSWCADGAYEFIIVQIEPEMLYPKSKVYSDRKYVYPFAFQNSQSQRVFYKYEFGDFSIDKIMRRILKECTDMEYGFELAVESDIYRIFIWILRYLKKKTVINAESYNLDESDIAFHAKMYDYIQHNYQLPITAKSVAKTVNMSYSYFSTVFNSLTHMSFAEYVNNIRLRKAEMQLISTNKSIRDIAAECGFCNSSYFIRKFRQRCGVSPLAYRKMHTVKPIRQI